MTYANILLKEFLQNEHTYVTNSQIKKQDKTPIFMASLTIILPFPKITLS